MDLFCSVHFFEFLTNCTKSAIDTKMTISEQSAKFGQRADSAMFGLRGWYHSDGDII